MTLATNLGFPRMGAGRELKRALESYWTGRSGRDDLLAAARDLRAHHWTLQRDAGIDRIPSNDFSLYDHMLDMTAALGAVPERYAWTGPDLDLDVYFAMARGDASVPAMEMTKWFDTNYHYIVPEIGPRTRFTLASHKAVAEYMEARDLGIDTRPVLPGPVSFLLLAKPADAGDPDPRTLLDGVLPVYARLLEELRAAGASAVQLDEPCLVLDLDADARAAFAPAYAAIRAAAGDARLTVATYFGGLRDNLETALALPVDALHVDLVRAPDQLDDLLDAAPPSLSLSLGLVDGRNIWRADLERSIGIAETAAERLGPDRIEIGPSCSLLHSPVDLENEPDLDPELRGWMAFARRKLDEIAAIATAVRHGRDAVSDTLAANRAAWESRRSSARTHAPEVRARVAAVTDGMLARRSPYPTRRAAQAERLGLPALPTTTIGSYPQTVEVRRARARHRRGEISDTEYEAFLRAETERTIRAQEEAGLDVLVHGEFERTDMVEYFGEKLAGFARTANGWVQSYGSRCVKPPVIFGDVSRPLPMTVDWWRFAQSVTDRPVKGMLTGPITILQWSFVRDDQPRSDTARQIALALRDEVVDLEAAGCPIIQIDEPALREGLPLRRADHDDYLRWAVDAFRLAASGVGDETQIHTHMCYSEFNEIIAAIAELDADVISIEAARSRMKLLEAFRKFDYPNEIGPGIYDIHSPRVPPVEEMVELLIAAARVIPADRLWVNPDCGLKTRQWEEVQPALAAMAAAARRARDKLAPTGT